MLKKDHVPVYASVVYSHVTWTLTPCSASFFSLCRVRVTEPFQTKNVRAENKIDAMHLQNLSAVLMTNWPVGGTVEMPVLKF